jgi:hypothetical protein
MGFSFRAVRFLQNAALSRGRSETMPYAGIITSAEHAPGVLEDIAPFFASGIATIRRRENQWILESSSFEPYESDENFTKQQTAWWHKYIACWHFI